MTAFSSGLKVLTMSDRRQRREKQGTGRREMHKKSKRVQRQKGAAGGEITRGGNGGHKSSPVDVSAAMFGHVKPFCGNWDLKWSVNMSGYLNSR